jgi:nitroreductase
MTQADSLYAMINARHSDGLLVAPAPSVALLHQAIEAALTAPDHHRLQPWRFLTVQGEARYKMGAVLREALVARGETDEIVLNKVLGSPLRAPLILICIIKVQSHPKVPEVEQILSMGAAVQNILLMLQAQGFSGMWRTGAVTTSALVKQAFGLDEHDIIAGFVYIGSLTRQIAARSPANVEDFLQDWQ